MALSPSLLLLATMMLVGMGPRSFVDPATIPEAPPTKPLQLFHEPPPSRGTQPPQQDEEEAQLASLKQPPALSVVESHSERRVAAPVTSSGVKDAQEVHSDTRQRVSLDGKLVASLDQSVDKSPSQPGGVARAELNVPALGVHQQVQAALPAEISAQRRSPGPIFEQDMRGGPPTPANGAQFSPLDMSQYIFWTGDERGVSLAIQEFLQQGLMSREEAVGFLREIRQGLDALQSYYSQRRNEQQAAEQQAMERAAQLQQALALSRLRQAAAAASQEQFSLMKKSSEGPLGSSQPPLLSEEEYSELLQRLRDADALYTEYSLEEIIYQLAKALFSQSLDRGSGEAQLAMRRFSEFLQRETEQGRITRGLETKVLDVLGASLMDALRDRPSVDLTSGKGPAPRPLSPQLLMTNKGGAKAR